MNELHMSKLMRGLGSPPKTAMRDSSWGGAIRGALSELVTGKTCGNGGSHSKASAIARELSTFEN